MTIPTLLLAAALSLSGSPDFDERELGSRLLALVPWGEVRNQSFTHPDPEVRVRCRENYHLRTPAMADSLSGGRWPSVFLCCCFVWPDTRYDEAYEWWNDDRTVRGRVVHLLNATGDPARIKALLLMTLGDIP